MKFGEAITRKIDQLSAQSVDTILIYIPKEYESLTAYANESEKFDLHDYVKAYAAQRQVLYYFLIVFARLTLISVSLNWLTQNRHLK